MSTLRSLRCAAYRAYDWAKTSPLSVLFFWGRRYKHFKNISVLGTVMKIEGSAIDGDWTFDIGRETQIASGLHCEVTPCDPQPVLDVAKTLAVGDTVLVLGTLTFDPDHQGDPDHWELHPVQKLTKLTKVV